MPPEQAAVCPGPRPAILAAAAEAVRGTQEGVLADGVLAASRPATVDRVQLMMLGERCCTAACCDSREENSAVHACSFASSHLSSLQIVRLMRSDPRRHSQVQDLQTGPALQTMSITKPGRWRASCSAYTHAVWPGATWQSSTGGSSAPLTYSAI